MKKIRNWSSMRLTRSKSRKQEEALLQHAMNQQPSNSSDKKSRVLSVFINDFTDPDNQAAALVWAKFLTEHENLKGIYIAEPRHVQLGEYLTGEDFKECLALLKRLRPRLGALSDLMPITTMLAGHMTEDIISDLKSQEEESLTQKELRLLQQCVRPRALNEEAYPQSKEEANMDRAPKKRPVVEQDAITHAHLLVMDFLSTMRTTSGPSFDTYVDCKCVSALERPINLKVHSHEELVFRTASELHQFKEIIERPENTEEKAERLRDWYALAVERKMKDFGNQQPWRDLEDYDILFDEMDTYDRVIVFGGCSLTVLDQLLQQTSRDSLSKKVAYYQQGGTFDPAINILGNPLNFALNYKAAHSVFEGARKLAKFTLIPTDTTKRFTFTVKGLTEWSAAVGLHALGFYGKVEIWDLISDEEIEDSSASTADIIKWRSKMVLDDPKYKDPDTTGYKAIIADLVAFLIAFTDAFKDYPTPNGAVSPYEIGVIMSEQPFKGNGGMVLKELGDDKSASITALMLSNDKGDRVQRPARVALLVEDTSTLITRAIESGSSHY